MYLSFYVVNVVSDLLLACRLANYVFKTSSLLAWEATILNSKWKPVHSAENLSPYFWIRHQDWFGDRVALNKL